MRSAGAALNTEGQVEHFSWEQVDISMVKIVVFSQSLQAGSIQFALMDTKHHAVLLYLSHLMIPRPSTLGSLAHFRMMRSTEKELDAVGSG